MLFETRHISDVFHGEDWSKFSIHRSFLIFAVINLPVSFARDICLSHPLSIYISRERSTVFIIHASFLSKFIFSHVVKLIVYCCWKIPRSTAVISLAYCVSKLVYLHHLGQLLTYTIIIALILNWNRLRTMVIILKLPLEFFHTVHTTPKRSRNH